MNTAMTFWLILASVLIAAAMNVVKQQKMEN